MLNAILTQKITNSDYVRIIQQRSSNFSEAELQLLQDILEQFEFNPIDAQALVQAVDQQSKFDPNALHIEEDDEDTTGVCPHCLTPPIPPLRDYEIWRNQRA